MKPNAKPTRERETLAAGLQAGRFTITVEVVPPASPESGPLLKSLNDVRYLPFHGFSVATNPVAKPHMSALVFSFLLQQQTGIPATLHCTTRDHSRLGIMSLLWGARALGIGSVLATTGDYVALGAEHRTSFVRDVDVYDLVGLATEAGHFAGVAFDPGLESERLSEEVKRLELKARAGAQFAVTQPVFDAAAAELLFGATRHIGMPIILGILPLRTARHAAFLHERVAGVVIPETVQLRLERAPSPLVEGVAGAREMLAIARSLFAGACIMPPFGRYEILSDLLA